MARQVSHRNVCRVYDIGEADGPHLPDDGVRRRGGSGVAAEADRTVSAGSGHRDRASVVRGTRGGARTGRAAPRPEARERDDRSRGAGAHHGFRAGGPRARDPRHPRRHPGLHGAGAARGPRGLDPQRHLRARPRAVRNLHGRRAFDAKTIAELLRMHDEGLSRDAEQRGAAISIRWWNASSCAAWNASPRGVPASAIAVSAALPGGDPLAAALAAGETPSPEMVANAGRRDAISPVYGLSAIAVIVRGHRRASRRRAMQTSDRPSHAVRTPARRARRIGRGRISKRSAIARPPRDTASGFNHDGDYARWVERTRRGDDRWRELPAGRDADGDVLVSHESGSHRAARHDAPRAYERSAVDQPGMTSVRVDTRGRLLWFQAMPPRHETARSHQAQDTRGLLRAVRSAASAASALECQWRAVARSPTGRAVRGRGVADGSVHGR